MNSECEKLALGAAEQNDDHLSFLLQLCEFELIERERRAGERRLKSAKFPRHKTLEEFDFKARPNLNKPLMLELIRGDYIENNENVLLVGASWTGSLDNCFGNRSLWPSPKKKVMENR